ncbi:hypothetical protein [Nonomuraea sp. NPDC050643]|uniref:hypothetical protein n=1 Tax=Nonomuraea sp. NPDC050643 TaxID=3155660 RepID=UPI0033D3FB7E
MAGVEFRDGVLRRIVLGEHPERLGRRGGGQFADEGSVAALGKEAVADAAYTERG